MMPNSELAWETPVDNASGAATEGYPPLSLVRDDRREADIEIETTPPVWLREIVDRLNSLLALDDDWDSYGANRVSKTASIHALKFLLKLPAPWSRLRVPDFSPVPDGSVQLEWNSTSGSLEISIDDDGRMYLYATGAHGQIDNDGISPDTFIIDYWPKVFSLISR